MKVFVTVGTTKFDALIRALDTEECMRILYERGVTSILMQIGHGEYIPSAVYATLKVDSYRHNPQYKKDVENADLIISHAGAGSIMDALSAKKKLIVVVNTALMDNHQMELAQAMANQQYCLQTTCEQLSHMLQTADWSTLQPYPKPDLYAFPSLVNRVMFGSE